VQISFITKSKLRNISIKILYQLAQILQQNTSHINQVQPRKVVHVSPQYFSEDSYIGGGERYPTALAQTMANDIQTVLISFGETRCSMMQENLRIEIYRGIKRLPDFIFYLWELVTADIVHCHQYKTFITNLTILISTLLGKRVFVTDHGGWKDNFADRLPIHNLVHTFLTVSDTSAKSLELISKVQTIYGGVAQQFINLKLNEERDHKVLFVGRLIPNKGINYLIEAVNKDTQVDIIGRKYDEKYFSKLKELAIHKQIKFINSATDDDIIAAYQSSMITVLPSVYVDVNGCHHPNSELLGLVLLESMACGTPVICTNVGGMPEIVVDKVTGFVVPPNDPDALSQCINYLLDNPHLAREMGRKARQKVLEDFTWEAVVKRCLIAYSS
jgi:glycosyltransferase involved in cell wall biosynthesis